LRVEEIISRSRRQVHRLTPFARVNGVAITYPPAAVMAARFRDERRG
jgi:hypothetical protein